MNESTFNQVNANKLTEIIGIDNTVASNSTDETHDEEDVL